MSTMLKEVYDALKEAGASEEKASAAAVAVAAYQLNRSNLASKEDIAALKEDIAKLKEGTTDLRTELRTTHAKLAAEIERMGRVVIMWNIGTLIAVAGLVFAIIRFTGGGSP